MRIRGPYLWMVLVNDDGTEYWITSKLADVSEAANNAVRFFLRKGLIKAGEPPKLTLEFHGEIDA